jgi:acyl-[acyl carrier protein]--UDP-N-acetylglucosamine O-acyltransferase
MPIHPTAIVGMAPESRELIDQQMEEPANLMISVHPYAIVGAQATVDRGLTRATIVGARAFLMKKTHVGHDAQVWEDCEVAPGAVIAGYAILRRGVKVGINASILPYVCVGEGAVVGAGAVVTRHVLAGETVMGNPARPRLGYMTEFQLARELGRRKPGDLRCGCLSGAAAWEGCPHHGSKPIC